eukprot:jgi/Tetstr1/447436/TSEL_003695.t1
MASGAALDFVERFTAECPRLARVATLLSAWLAASLLKYGVSRLRYGAALLLLPMSSSEGAVSGWPVALLCWAGAETCLDAQTLLQRRVQAAAAEVDARIVVGRRALCFSPHALQDAYERWLARTPFRRALDLLAGATCLLTHIKSATMPECGALRYQVYVGVWTLMTAGFVLGRDRLGPANASLLGLLTFSYVWALHVGMLAAGDRCYGAICSATYAGSMAEACGTACSLFFCLWLLCPVSQSLEKFKALSGWAGYSAASYMHILYRDGALSPEVDVDGRALLLLLCSMSIAVLVSYLSGTWLCALNMRQFLRGLRSAAEHQGGAASGGAAASASGAAAAAGFAAAPARSASNDRS